MKKDLRDAILQEILKEKPHLKKNKKALQSAFKGRLKEIERDLKFNSSKLEAAKFGTDFKKLVSKAYNSYASLILELKKILTEILSSSIIPLNKQTVIISLIEASTEKPSDVLKSEKSLLHSAILKSSAKIVEKQEGIFKVKFFKDPNIIEYSNKVSRERCLTFAENSLNRIKTQTPNVVSILKQKASEVFEGENRPETLLKEIRKVEGFIEKRKNHMGFIARETYRQVNREIINETCLNAGLTKFCLIHNDNLSIDKKNIRQHHKDWWLKRKIFILGIDPDPREELNCHCTKKFIIEEETYYL